MRRREITKRDRTLTTILLAYLPVPIIAIHLSLTAGTDLHQGVIWSISGMMALVYVAQMIWVARRRRSIAGRVLATWLDRYRTSRIHPRNQASGAA